MPRAEAMPPMARRTSWVMRVSLAILAFALRSNAGTLSDPASSSAAPPNVIYEFSAVAASSEQTPSIDLDDAVDARLAVELDEGRPIADAGRRLGLQRAELRSRVDAMVGAELLRPARDGIYTPTFPTIRRADAAMFRAIDTDLVDELVRLVEQRQPSLQKEFSETLHLDAQQTRALSLVLLGDVLFDRWQVRNVRKDFLPGYPPARGGKSFYLLASEDARGPTASLGFYSHTEQRYGDVQVVAFGNARTLDPFAGMGAMQISSLLDTYLGLTRGKSLASAELSDLGFVQNGKPAVAVISSDMYASLPGIADRFSVDLLAALNAHRAKIREAYEHSRYAGRVSFQEFALWWYHFFYAAVIDRLAGDGSIITPAAGYAVLIVAPPERTAVMKASMP